MFTPDLLRENAARIRKLDVDNQPVEFNPDTWRKHIPELDDILVGIPGNTISRQILFDIFPGDPMSLEPCTKARQSELRRFFVLVMIWGYGKVGRGPWRVARMLRSPHFAKTLCQVSEECFYGLFLKALETLIRDIDSLGPAFATKYLYFLCRNFKAPVKPLIFDSVVVRSMRSFNWPAWAVDYMAYGNIPRRQSHAFGQYLILMHNWAEALHCRADQIEYYLWARGMGTIR